MQTLFNAWITQNLIWCPYLMVSYLCIFRTLRMVLGPRRERNHSGLPSAPLQEPNTLPDIFCSFHCFQFNQFFSHKLKIICHRIYLLLFNWGMSKQEFQEKLISTTIGVFCDIKEGHLASRAMYLLQCPVTSVAWLKIRECSFFCYQQLPETQGESSVSDPPLHIHKTSLG